MSEKSHRQLVFVSSIVLLGLLPAACGGPKEAPITVPAGAQAGDLVGLEPCTYKMDKVEYSADCGTLIVPENRSDPNSRLIALPVIRVRATGSNPGEPIFWLVGGPNSNVTPADDTARLDGLIDDRDFVMVGYRGLDGSVVLQCPEAQEAVKASENLYSDSEMDNVEASLKRCAGRFQAEGVDLDGYNIVEIVDDMEAARVALGYERIDLLSQSFGSRVAMIYAWRYPDSLYRVVMYAAIPPGRLVTEPEKVDEQLAYYASLCAQDAECSTRTDDLVRTMRNVSHNMPNRWLFMPIDAYSVKFGSRALLMLPQASGAMSGPGIVDLWIAAEKGDPSGLAMGTLLSKMIIPNGFTWRAVYSHMLSVDLDPSRDYRAELNPPGSTIGAPIWYLAAGTASGWPVNLIPQEYRQVQPSGVEMLLVSGPLDFTAPPGYVTEELLPHLSNGQQVILREFGHTVDFWSLQPEARVRLLTSFYDTGVADDSLYTYQPVDFHVGFGFPEMAKLLVAIPVLIIAIVVAGVWFITRRVRRRRIQADKRFNAGGGG